MGANGAITPLYGNFVSQQNGLVCQSARNNEQKDSAYGTVDIPTKNTATKDSRKKKVEQEFEFHVANRRQTDIFKKHSLGQKLARC